MFRSVSFGDVGGIIFTCIYCMIFFFIIKIKTYISPGNNGTSIY